jgi:hypothetical protein
MGIRSCFHIVTQSHLDPGPDTCSLVTMAMGGLILIAGTVRQMTTNSKAPAKISATCTISSEPA